jgi:hypothetical protein
MSSLLCAHLISCTPHRALHFGCKPLMNSRLHKENKARTTHYAPHTTHHTPHTTHRTHSGFETSETLTQPPLRCNSMEAVAVRHTTCMMSSHHHKSSRSIWCNVRVLGRNGLQKSRLFRTSVLTRTYGISIAIKANESQQCRDVAKSCLLFVVRRLLF